MMEARFNEAVGYLQQGQSQRAQAILLELHRVLPAHPDILFLLGAATSMLGQRAQAVLLYDQLLRLVPEFVPALNAKGLDLAALGKPVEALAAFDQALTVAPEFVEAAVNKAALLNTLGRYTEALALLLPNQAIAHPPLQINLGVAYFSLGDYAQAEQCAHSVLQQYANEASALALLGAVCLKKKQLPQALAYCQKAAALNPQDASVRNNIAAILSEQGLFAEAAVAYEQTLQVDKAYPFARGALLHTRMKAVLWDGLDELLAEIRQGIRAGRQESDPFALLATNINAAEQKQCAETYAANRYPAVVANNSVSGKRSANDKIRIAYLSADFFNHATAYLMAELFELHDRERFEIIGFCYGRSPDDEMRQRVVKAFDQFFEVADLSDQVIAEQIRSLNIDIAVDLKGHTTDTRLGIFAHRPAPIQVHYLGYPGTTGTPFIDYLIADPVLIPPAQQAFYSEQIAYLPGCYQVNDRTRRISDRVFTRTELGLPETSFVFCSFNNNFKITPDVFDVWMRLLERIPGSVLWLFQDNQIAADNLRKEAKKRGVNSERLVFAERMPLPEHLARHRCADLFLDTWYCNAHTTASDALWAGLPLVTMLGETFAGRVAASLLNAINLSDLVTETPQAYEDLAFELATNPERLAAIKAKLVAEKATSPLFDTQSFARNIEALYSGLLKNAKRRSA